MNSTEYQLAYNKVYYQKYKEKIKKATNAYTRKRRSEDSFYRLKLMYADRFRRMFKYYLNKDFVMIRPFKNPCKFEQTIGCSLIEYKEYLQSKFKDGMSFKNYGEWHIDHIIPLSKACNEEQLKLLMLKENTQPLWASDNLHKHKKIHYELH